jgi:hypothetical protein
MDHAIQSAIDTDCAFLEVGCQFHQPQNLVLGLSHLSERQHILTKPLKNRPLVRVSLGSDLLEVSCCRLSFNVVRLGIYVTTIVVKKPIVAFSIKADS